MRSLYHLLIADYQNMPASRGKALPLLRIINAFLRFLPRTPEYLVFRGRIHHFASSVIGIAERSAVNFRGDYADVKTTWEEFIVAPPDPIETLEVKAEQVEKSIEADGDVKMEEKTTADVPQAKEQPAQDLYSTLWSLQQYFASPPLLGRPAKDVSGSTTWDDFQKRSDFVLPKLFEQTKKQVEMLGKEDVPGVVGSKRKRESDDEGFFHPRYLTPRRLFEHQVGLGVTPYAACCADYPAWGSWLPTTNLIAILHPLSILAQSYSCVESQTIVYGRHAERFRH